MTLHELATKGDIDTFQTISLEKFDINGKNEHGYTPLMLAAHNGHREFSRYLIGLGADVNSIDNSGHSILMSAAKRGHHEIIKHLIEKGAAIDYTNSEGQTALDLAQMSGRGESVAIIESFQKPVAFSLIDTLAQWVSQLKFNRKECNCMP